jgi:hypothetical protein
MQLLPRNSDEFVQREECYSTLSKQELAPSGNPVDSGVVKTSLGLSLSLS